jgi:hypothetical protein
MKQMHPERKKGFLDNSSALDLLIPSAVNFSWFFAHCTEEAAETQKRKSLCFKQYKW